MFGRPQVDLWIAAVRLIVIVAIVFSTTSRERLVRGLILVAVILLFTSLCYLRIQTLSAWILNSSFHVLTATSMNPTNCDFSAVKSRNNHYQTRWWEPG